MLHSAGSQQLCLPLSEAITLNLWSKCRRCLGCRKWLAAVCRCAAKTGWCPQHSWSAWHTKGGWRSWWRCTKGTWRPGRSHISLWSTQCCGCLGKGRQPIVITRIAVVITWLFFSRVESFLAGHKAHRRWRARRFQAVGAKAPRGVHRCGGYGSGIDRSGWRHRHCLRCRRSARHWGPCTTARVRRCARSS